MNLITVLSLAEVFCYFFMYPALVWFFIRPQLLYNSIKLCYVFDPPESEFVGFVALCFFFLLGCDSFFYSISFLC